MGSTVHETRPVINHIVNGTRLRFRVYLWWVLLNYLVSTEMAKDSSSDPNFNDRII